PVGPRDANPHLIPDVLAQLGKGDSVRLGNLEPVRDYVHLEDLAAALVTLLEADHESCSVFNVGSGEGRSVREVLAAFEAALGRPLSVVQDPGRVRKVERPRLVADTGKLRGPGCRRSRRSTAPRPERGHRVLAAPAPPAKAPANPPSSRPARRESAMAGP